ncbi:hypothetical protein Q9L58_009086 [Maublancomyces gigas]|uniref:Uncharacterized protein n=1 Tax=Discina gigas TaxID=1032678 RepID=A0ABR3G7Z0_9PEZI
MKERLQDRKTDWEKVREVVEKEVRGTEEEWKRARDNEDVEDMARIMEETMRKGVYEGTPVEKPTWRSKKWFDDEVNEKRKEMVKIKRWRKGRSRWERNEEDEEWKKKREEYMRLIRKKKKEMSDKYVEEAESNEAMWAVWRMTRKNRFAKTPTLRKGETRAVKFEEKEELLRKVLFQEETKTDEQHERWEKRERVEISEQQVRQAFRKMGGLKAPGKDEIVVKAIKETMEIIGERLREIYQLAVNCG